MELSENDIVRFWDKVDKSNPNGCWVWKSVSDRDGYGRFWASPKKIKAHRFSYIISKGEIPDEMCILHSCNNPSCVNPSHLRTGTHSENMADAVLAGHSQKGEKAHSAKLTYEKAETIRQLYSSGNYSQKDLAETFQVNGSTISRLLTGKRWR